MAEENELTPEEYDKLADLQRERDELKDRQKTVMSTLELEKREWLRSRYLEDHSAIEKTFAKEFSLSLTDAKKHLDYKLKKYEIEGNEETKRHIKNGGKVRLRANGTPVQKTN